MAEGGLLSSSLVEEPASRKRGAIESLFDRLVEETKTEVRDSTEKLFQRSAINQQQKESVIKTLSKHHLETDYAASVLFQLVLKNVEDDDRHFDRLVFALRDMELDKLAEELRRASLVAGGPHPPTSMDETEMEHDVLPDSPKKMGGHEELSLYDSGIVPANYSYSVSSTNVAAYGENNSSSSNQNSQRPENDQPNYPSQGQQFYLPINENPANEESLSLSPETTPVVTPLHNLPTVPLDDLQGDSLQSQPQLQEPESDDSICDDQQEPIQVDNDQSNSLLLVPSLSGNSTSIMGEIEHGGNSENDKVVDQVTQQLMQMHLELQNKKRELEARAQEMQQNSDLIIRCQELEEHVKKMEEEVRAQKMRANKLSNQKDIEINSLKIRYEEKESEIQMLRVTIARQEQEKRKLTEVHKAEIKKRQDKYVREVDEYKEKVKALDSALKEATQKKEEAEQQLKEAHSEIEVAKLEKHKVTIELMKEMLEKEKELSQIKEDNLKLEIEIKDLVVHTKEQEALLHQKDKELAEHKQAAAEEKHDTCAKELRSQRRHSQQLLDENNKLKRQLSEYLERVSATESLAKRSKTE